MQVLAKGEGENELVNRLAHGMSCEKSVRASLCSLPRAINLEHLLWNREIDQTYV